jgi:hypothetical protein
LRRRCLARFAALDCCATWPAHRSWRHNQQHSNKSKRHSPRREICPLCSLLSYFRTQRATRSRMHRTRSHRVLAFGQCSTKEVIPPVARHVGKRQGLLKSDKQYSALFRRECRVLTGWLATLRTTCQTLRTLALSTVSCDRR